ncbi:MAG: RNA polymerase sigma factor [Candidatus Latescibacterota bacterium]
MQTTLVRLYRSIDKYRFQSRLGTHLIRILINVCYDMLEAQKRRQQLDLEFTEPVHLPGSNLRLQLEEAILTLPERMRACFVLFAMEGYPQKEIAEMLDVSVGTVKAQIFQAKEKLRVLLTDPPKEASS